jgi:hypothetical protein
VKSSLCKIKKRTGNPIPEDIVHFDELLQTAGIRAQYKLNLGNGVLADMYLGMVGVPPNRSLVFAHTGLITRISTRKSVYVDATFYSVPNQPNFRQLLCMQTRHLGVVSTVYSTLKFYLLFDIL